MSATVGNRSIWLYTHQSKAPGWRQIQKSLPCFMSKLIAMLV